MQPYGPGAGGILIYCDHTHTHTHRHRDRRRRKRRLIGARLLLSIMDAAMLQFPSTQDTYDNNNNASAGGADAHWHSEVAINTS